MLRSVKAAQRLPREIIARINGVGAAAITIGANEITATRTGAGVYSVVAKTAFQRQHIAFANCETAGLYAECTASNDFKTITVRTKATSNNAATDAVFQLLIKGFDAADEA